MGDGVTTGGFGPLSISTAESSVEGLWREPEAGKRVIICTPTITKPYQCYLDSLAASVPLIQAAGWSEGAVWEVGNPYISVARAMMLRKALDDKADVVVFIDHDLSWQPDALLRLIETEGDVVCGTYRFKREPVEYMGQLIPDAEGRPVVREDGCIKAHSVPAGFLKVTRRAVNKFMASYPELIYGERCHPHVDLFNHGAHDYIWYGEDYAFSRNWREKCGDIWVVPDLDINHHTKDAMYPGNYHRFLLSLGAAE